MKKLYSLHIALIVSFINYSQTIQLNQIASSFNNITEITNAGDDRLFITEQPGEIIILNPDSSRSTFLDIRSLVRDGGERGLLGLAFAPDYSTSGRFYVNYTNNSSDTVIARYTVSSDPDIANTSGTILLNIDQPRTNHNGGKILFGPDGYLYIGVGDGGGAGDPNNYSQNTESLLGKLLRIDVSGATYTIPDGNPYKSEAGEPEIYAVGLRNPWRMAFDTVTDELWIADVGQNKYDEINVVDYTVPNLNYGWRCYEGAHTYNTNGGNCPSFPNTVAPASEYSISGNSERCSVTGGYVYRGADYPSLIGKYFFGDYCSEEIGFLTRDGSDWTVTYLSPSNSERWTTFGEDNNSELYVAGASRIYRITDPNLSTSEFSKYDLKLFPNPANNEINLDFGSRYAEVDTVTIFTLQGQKIEEVKTNNNETLNLSTEAYSAGLYLVELSSNKGLKVVEKLVIK